MAGPPSHRVHLTGPCQPHTLIIARGDCSRAARVSRVRCAARAKRGGGGKRGAALLRMKRGRRASPQIIPPARLLRQHWPSCSHVNPIPSRHPLHATPPAGRALRGDIGAELREWGQGRPGQLAGAMRRLRRRVQGRRDDDGRDAEAGEIDGGDQHRRGRGWAVPVTSSDKSSSQPSPRTTLTVRRSVLTLVSLDDRVRHAELIASRCLVTQARPPRCALSHLVRY